MILRHLGVFLVSAFLCSGCVSQYKVVVDFSPELRDYFTEYPTIEVDIAAVTDSEAGEVKQAGVEQYFAPGAGFRDRLGSQTCFFSREDDVKFVLPSRAPVWKAWLDKGSTNLLVIASLPHDPSMTPQADPRCLVVIMKKSYILARTIYILVEPKKVIQVAKPSAASKSPKNTSRETEQWIEARRRSQE